MPSPPAGKGGRKARIGMGCKNPVCGAVIRPLANAWRYRPRAPRHWTGPHPRLACRQPADARYTADLIAFGPATAARYGARIGPPDTVPRIGPPTWRSRRSTRDLEMMVSPIMVWATTSPGDPVAPSTQLAILQGSVSPPGIAAPGLNISRLSVDKRPWVVKGRSALTGFRVLVTGQHVSR